MAESGEKMYQVNIEELIKEYVWKRYKEDASFFTNLLFRKNRHYIDIRWGYVLFQHNTKKSDPISIKEKELDLYVAEYENITTEEQKYTFSKNQETTATTRVEIQDSYTIGAETSLEVDLGGIVKFGGGVNGEMSISNTNGEEHSEVQSWTIDTEIKVPEKCRAIAKLELKEVSKKINFEVETTISLPQGKLPVSIRKKADDQIVKTYWITNISKIFTKEKLSRCSDTVTVDKPLKPGTNQVDIQLKIKTRGVVQTVSGKEQRVVVEYKELTARKESVDEKKPVSEDQSNITKGEPTQNTADKTAASTTGKSNGAGIDEESDDKKGSESDHLLVK